MKAAFLLAAGLLLALHCVGARDCAEVCPPIPECTGGNFRDCIKPLVQRTDVTCWAASTAMLLQYQKGREVTEQQAAEWGGLASQGAQAGSGAAAIAPRQTSRFIQALNNNDHVKPDRLVELQASLTVPGLCGVAKNGAIFGSHFQDTDPNHTNPSIPFHIQVLVGMEGDCSDDRANYETSGRSKVVIQDPWLGTRRVEDFNEFVGHMETQHSRLYEAIRAQIARNPSDPLANEAREWSQLVYVHFSRPPSSFLETFMRRKRGRRSFSRK